MAARKTTFSVRVPQGGRLITSRSPENVGVGNYTTKTNWRRVDDREVLREGTLLFRPDTVAAQGSQHLNVAGEVIGVWEAVRPNGDRAIVAATATTIYRYNESTDSWDTIGSGFDAIAQPWQAESLDGYLILNNDSDLPVTYRVEDSAVVPIYEMRDVGIAHVGVISVYNGFLKVADITEIQPAYQATVMNGATPYGIVDPSYCNRIRYKIAWSDYGQPRNWAPVITGVIESATKNKVTLDAAAPHAFPVGAKLAVIGAGPNGTTLGGQPGYDDGVAVTVVSGRELTLETSADSSLSYPLQVQVTRFADTSTFVGSSTIKDDSSPIVAMKPLKQIVVVYRTTGIWIGRYTGQVETPFIFKPAYHGNMVPAYPRCVMDVEGDYHLYPSQNGFFMFDGAGNPVTHEPLDDASSLFFDGITASNAYKLNSSFNPITREVWFHSINGVLAFDIASKTASWIDEAYGAAVYAKRPGGTEYWFVLAKAGQILQYGALDSGPLVYRRLGVAVNHVLSHGEVSLNDDENEKDIHSYMPLFARVTNPVTVTLYGRDNIADTADTLCTVILETPREKPLIETFYRNVYFKDLLTYQSTDDSPAEYVGSTYTFAGVASAGVTRNLDGTN